MVIALFTQAVFVIIILLCPWDGLANYMEVEVMNTADKEQTIFRIYLLLIPVLHLILAIGIEVSYIIILYKKQIENFTLLIKTFCRLIVRVHNDII